MDTFDIEKLNKSQIILLTLLTSFVTSIATGIVTVSLMEQAPPAIAQTVNRIVERTVEKVMPAVQAAASAQSKTVVIKESDLIAQAIDQIRISIVRLYSTDGKDAVFLGMGLVLNKSGAIATDLGALADLSTVIVEQSGGQHVRATVSRSDKVSGLAYLSTATSTIDGKDVAWVPVTLSSGTIALGQTIFTVYGKSNTRVDDGIVTALAIDAAPGLVDTNIEEASIVAGSPLINTDGSIVAIRTSVARDASASGFIPAGAISLEPKVPAKDIKADVKN